MQKLTYSFLRKTYLFELLTEVVQIQKDEKNTLIEFADTIFHPQGGGQPNDIGNISFQNKIYPILGGIPNKQTGKITYKFDGQIQGLEIGSQVFMKIDKQNRIKNARLHSAGHLIDVAVSRCKFGWKPSKGYHFEDSPYVEYFGTCEDNNAARLKLQQEINNVLKEENEIGIFFFTNEEALAQNLIDPSYKSETIRVIKMYEQQCPCGGTHVQKSSDVAKIEIIKVAKKGKNLRVSYKL